MNAFTIAGLVGIVVIITGILLALLWVWLSKLVTRGQLEFATEKVAFNPAVTLGHRIPIDAEPKEQLRVARKEAARTAASLPRGGNRNIGSRGASTLRTASENLDNDAMSAVRIAQFHTWQGARTGIPAAGVVAAPVAAVAPVVVTKKPADLVPGVDYPVTEVTDDMSAADKRKARIANSKARSAAVKALKAAGATATVAAAAPGTPPAAPAAVPVAPVIAVPEPDYIEMTDDMSPDEKRKARIANAKAKSAYKKALKEAEAAAPAVAVAPQTQAVPAAVAPPPVVAVPEPDYIEMTDDMSPDEKRKARIANAKAKSAYKKALKEAGVTTDATQPAAAQPAPAPVAQAAPPVQSAPPPVAEITVPKPDLVEMTDDMSPDEMRRARIANAKAKSAYKKALKEAGIDPSTVEI